MAGLRLYRKIFMINHTPGNDLYTMIDPVFLTASTYNMTTTNLVEDLTVIQAATGLYYVDMTPDLYNIGDLFELRWTIQYINNSPIKILQTLFKYESNIIRIYRFGEIDFELEDESVNYEVAQQKEIIYEIIKQE